MKTCPSEENPNESISEWAELQGGSAHSTTAADPDKQTRFLWVSFAFSGFLHLRKNMAVCGLLLMPSDQSDSRIREQRCGWIHPHVNTSWLGLGDDTFSILWPRRYLMRRFLHQMKATAFLWLIKLYRKYVFYCDVRVHSLDTSLSFLFVGGGGGDTPPLPPKPGHI